MLYTSTIGFLLQTWFIHLSDSQTLYEPIWLFEPKWENIASLVFSHDKPLCKNGSLRIVEIWGKQKCNEVRQQRSISCYRTKIRMLMVWRLFTITKDKKSVLHCILVLTTMLDIKCNLYSYLLYISPIIIMEITVNNPFPFQHGNFLWRQNTTYRSLPFFFFF